MLLLTICVAVLYATKATYAVDNVDVVTPSVVLGCTSHNDCFTATDACVPRICVAGRCVASADHAIAHNAAATTDGKKCSLLDNGERHNNSSLGMCHRGACVAREDGAFFYRWEFIDHDNSSFYLLDRNEARPALMHRVRAYFDPSVGRVVGSFDADRRSIAYLPQMSVGNNFSMSMWFRLHDSITSSVIFAMRATDNTRFIQLQISSQMKLSLLVTDGITAEVLQFETVLHHNTWHFVGFDLSSTQIKARLNAKIETLSNPAVTLRDGSTMVLTLGASDSLLRLSRFASFDVVQVKITSMKMNHTQGQHDISYFNVLT